MEQTTESASLAEQSTDFLEIVLTRISALVAEYSLSVLGAIALLIIGYIVANVAERWSYRALGEISAFDETLRRFMSKIARYGVLVFVLVTVLAQFGVQTTSIIAALGAAGLAIGLALQGTLQNVAAGIMLLVLRPFRVGEFIDAGDVSGTVEEIGVFATQLTTFDGVFMLVPNSQLLNTAVINYTRRATRMFGLEIGIGYDDDIALAEKLMIELARKDERVLDDPAPFTFVSSLGDSAVLVTMRYWTSTADYWPAQRDMTKKAKLAFDENGISIPFPQRDVHYVDQTGAGRSEA